MKNNLMVVGFNVKCNANGLYNLNDIHKASGGDIKNTPSRWLRLKKTKDLIESVKKRGVRENLTTQKWVLGIETINGGRYAGVYAHELLVVSYAGWIDSDFQIEVNHTFLETIKERAAVLEQENKKLTEFKDDYYKKTLANNYLSNDYSKLNQDVAKGIRMIINEFKWRKKVLLSDVMFLPMISGKASKEALEYAKRNILMPIDDKLPPNKTEIFLR